MALVSFFVGGLADWKTDIFFENWASPKNGLPFWTLFAIFFPAVTGFTQGSSMSGDLKDPGRSLPRGTFAAVGLSVVIYVAVALVFAGTVPGRDLVADYGAMRQALLRRYTRVKRGEAVLREVAAKTTVVYAPNMSVIVNLMFG